MKTYTLSEREWIRDKAKHPELSNGHDQRAAFNYERKIARRKGNNALRNIPTHTFADYDLAEDGVLCADPIMDYWRATDGKKGPLLGVELEIEADRAPARISDSCCDCGDEDCSACSDPDCAVNLSRLKKCLAPLAGEYFVCRDGSLRCGVEIVFQPHSITGWRNNYTRIYKTLRSLSGAGFTSHESGRCGLHVHVSRGNGRTGYTSTQAEAAARFIVEHKEHFQCISRRDNFNYCVFSEDNDRYRALNRTNLNTVEYRFFRGTLIPVSFFGALETIAALNEYFIASRREYTFTGYVRTLKRYPLALQYVKSRHPACLERHYAKHLAEVRAEKERARKREWTTARERDIHQRAADVIKARIVSAMNTLATLYAARAWPAGVSIWSPSLTSPRNEVYVNAAPIWETHGFLLAARVAMDTVGNIKLQLFPTNRNLEPLESYPDTFVSRFRSPEAMAAYFAPYEIGTFPFDIRDRLIADPSCVRGMEIINPRLERIDRIDNSPASEIAVPF